jgi:hypothetical protein
LSTAAEYFEQAVAGLRQQLDADTKATWTITDKGPLNPEATGLACGRRYAAHGVSNKTPGHVMDWTVTVFPRDNYLVIRNERDGDPNTWHEIAVELYDCL